jgi:hypothetical protein
VCIGFSAAICGRSWWLVFELLKGHLCLQDSAITWRGGPAFKLLALGWAKAATEPSGPVTKLDPEGEFARLAKIIHFLSKFPSGAELVRPGFSPGHLGRVFGCASVPWVPTRRSAKTVCLKAHRLKTAFFHQPCAVGRFCCCLEDALLPDSRGAGRDGGVKFRPLASLFAQLLRPGLAFVPLLSYP